MEAASSGKIAHSETGASLKVSKNPSKMVGVVRRHQRGRHTEIIITENESI